MPLIGKILAGLLLALALYGTYTVGYYAGAKAVVDKTLDLAVEKGIDITKMLLD